MNIYIYIFTIKAINFSPFIFAAFRQHEIRGPGLISAAHAATHIVFKSSLSLSRSLYTYI